MKKFIVPFFVLLLPLLNASATAWVEPDEAETETVSAPGLLENSQQTKRIRGVQLA